MPSVLEALKSAPSQLSEEDIKQFNEKGYIAFKNVLSPEELENIRNAMERLCFKAFDGVKNETFTSRKGKGGGPFAGYNLRKKEGQFTVCFEAEADIYNMKREDLPFAYRKLSSYHDQDPVFEDFKSHKKCQTYLDQLLGKDSILSQDMALSKPARIGIKKPWHQDNAYFNLTPLNQVIGIWVAIDDATTENGCMQFLPRSRDNLVAHKHIHITDCEIDESEIDKDKVDVVEVPAGGAVLFLGMVPHQTLANTSDKSRRALQWHYRGADTVENEPEEYNKIFKTKEGAPAACFVG